MSTRISPQNTTNDLYSSNFVINGVISNSVYATSVVSSSSNSAVFSTGGISSGQSFATVSVPMQSFQSKEPTTIGAGLYFRYVKKKFTKIEQKELERRLIKLVNLRLQAITVDQQGLLESVEAMLLTAAREQALLVKGMDRYILKEHIDKFIKTSSTIKTKNIYMNQLDKFPRPIPTAVQKKIVAAKALQVFDEFQVLYTDYTATPVVKSVADKVREKDPIVFGTMLGAPDRLYYIADWIDEYCDLTLDKLVSVYKPENGESLVKELEALKTPESLKKLTARVQSRLTALDSVTRENWRQREKEAVIARAESLDVEKPVPAPSPVVAEEITKKKKSWFSFLT